MVKEMKAGLFYKLWKDAQGQPDKELYIAEYGYPEWFDEISTDLDEIRETLDHIHDMANMGMRDLIYTSKMTQASFARNFLIDPRTVRKWALGECKCPDYVRLLFLRQTGLLKIRLLTEEKTNEQD